MGRPWDKWVAGTCNLEGRLQNDCASDSKLRVNPRLPSLLPHFSGAVGYNHDLLLNSGPAQQEGRLEIGKTKVPHDHVHARAMALE